MKMIKMFQGEPGYVEKNVNNFLDLYPDIKIYFVQQTTMGANKICVSLIVDNLYKANSIYKDDHKREAYCDHRGTSFITNIYGEYDHPTSNVEAAALVQ